ncbi:hypothetical protein D1007_48548 [Hordeum vulgare]|nr:hypothetical protein D1007_48548 [Hordeum vulgare]
MNDIVRTLLLQANLTPPFWVEALHTATYLLNRRLSRVIAPHTPHFLLYDVYPYYHHLRVFGCLRFPNLYATMDHKLAPRSSPCIFLGYPLEHKGYRCYDLTTRRVIVSRHVVFDKTKFLCTPTPSWNTTPTSTDNLHATNLPHPDLSDPSPVPTSPGPRHQPFIAPRSPTTSSLPESSAGTYPSTNGSPASPGRSTSPRAPVPSAPHEPVSSSRSGHPSHLRTDPPWIARPPVLPITTASPTSATCTPPTPPIPMHAIPVAPPQNTHSMSTRAKTGYLMPKRLFLADANSATISPIPPTYNTALKDPHWRQAMLEEYHALMNNFTWSFMPKPAGVNIVTDK